MSRAGADMDQILGDISTSSRQARGAEVTSRKTVHQQHRAAMPTTLTEAGHYETQNTY